MIVHFVSQLDCSHLAALFPDEQWPLQMILDAPSQEELDALQELAEWRRAQRIAREVLAP